MKKYYLLAATMSSTATIYASNTNNISLSNKEPIGHTQEIGLITSHVPPASNITSAQEKKTIIDRVSNEVFEVYQSRNKEVNKIIASTGEELQVESSFYQKKVKQIVKEKFSIRDSEANIYKKATRILYGKKLLTEYWELIFTKIKNSIQEEKNKESIVIKLLQKHSFQPKKSSKLSRLITPATVFHPDFVDALSKLFPDQKLAIRGLHQQYTNNYSRVTAKYTGNTLGSSYEKTNHLLNFITKIDALFARDKEAKDDTKKSIHDNGTISTKNISSNKRLKKRKNRKKRHLLSSQSNDNSLPTSLSSATTKPEEFKDNKPLKKRRKLNRSLMPSTDKMTVSDSPYEDSQDIDICQNNDNRLSTGLSSAITRPEESYKGNKPLKKRSKRKKHHPLSSQ